MRILHVLPSLDHMGAARQISLLHQYLPDDFDCLACTLAGRDEGDRGCNIVSLAAGQRPGFVGVWKLRRLLVEFKPDVVHTWKSAALQTTVVAGMHLPFRLIASQPTPLAGSKHKLAFVSRLASGRVNCIVVRGAAEADSVRTVIRPADLAIVSPGLALDTQASDESDGETIAESTSGTILCAGYMEHHKGFIKALWTMDIIRFLFPRINLILIGAGPDRPALERFARRNQLMDRVQFLNPRVELRPFLNQADIVWIPSIMDGGVYMALEAMAAGKPVIASHLPALREIVEEGVTGCLVPPGDTTLLARCTTELLRDPARARSLGMAGRRRVLRDFRAEVFAQKIAGLYIDIAA
jgi:glycosyltransferase involved in cell wall biosynthesis